MPNQQELIHTSLLDDLQTLLEALADEPLSETMQTTVQHWQATLDTRQRVTMPDHVVYHQLCGLLYGAYNAVNAGEPRSAVREKYLRAQRSFEACGYDAADIAAAKAYAERDGYDFRLDDYL